MQTELGGGVPECATFAQALGTLKQEGSNILLVGDRAGGAHASVCQRLLGETGRGSRYRLFVVTDGRDCSCVDGLDHGESDSPTRIISQTEESRVLSDGTVHVPESVVGTEMLSTLGTEVIETVDELEAEADGLDPSELRVCIDSLVPLINEHTAENVFRLLHMMTSRVRQVNGMGHFHLPVDRDHDAVRLFEPLFDAVVEVRSRSDTTEQRWHLLGQRTSSEWIPL